MNKIKNKKICVAVCCCSIILVIVYIISAYRIYSKYSIPDEKYISVGEEFIYKDIQYRLSDMEMLTYDQLSEKYDVSIDKKDDIYRDDRKYFIAVFDVTAISEDGSFYIDIFGLHNKYASGNMMSVVEMSQINNGYTINVKKGETTKFVAVASLIDFEFKEDTWSNITEEDVYFRLFDMENALVYYIGKDV